MLRKYIGDRAFYRRALALMVPIMLQNGITNFVNMLDNVMVGRVGTAEMSGVAVANQLIFVLNLCLFGAVSGAGIFGAQYHGSGDVSGVRHTFRFKILFCSAMTAVAGAVLLIFGPQLVGLYLRGEGDAASAARSLECAMDYIRVMAVGFLPFTLAQCWASTLRETGRATPPMAAGVAAVLVNLLLNYVLIFGHFGAPALGVVGAAVATVVSRFVELAVLIVWTFANRATNPFIAGAFKSMRVPLPLARQIVLRGMPLMVNEAFWSSGMAILSQCYSLRGLDVVAANNISQTFFNVFAVAFMSVGATIGIIVGQHLGADEMSGAADSARKLIALSVFISVLVGAVYFVLARYIPLLYRTTGSVRELATLLMRITAVTMPLDAFANATYFTIRSGGKTLITFLFDSGFVWAVTVPLAFVLSRFTGVGIAVIFTACQCCNLLRDILGYVFVKKGIWLRNLVA